MGSFLCNLKIRENLWFFYVFRRRKNVRVKNQPPEVFYKKGLPKNLAKFTGRKTPASESLF